MKLSFRLLCLGALVSALPLFAELRCPNQPFPASQCEGVRLEAKRIGCINDAQYLSLKAQNRFPACMGSSFLGDCPCGCFAPEALIDFLGGEGGLSQERAETLYKMWSADKGGLELATLDPKSHLANPAYTAKSVGRATVGDETHPLVRITFDDGRVLRITEKHPVLKSTGEMITGRELTKGDALVNRDGSLAPIRELTREPYHGPVYNFEAQSEDLAGHVIVAEGVLVGDLAWQNALEEELGGIAIRQ